MKPDMWLAFNLEEGDTTLFNTEEQARSYAQKWLDYAREESVDGWPEGMETVGWAKVQGRVVETMRKEKPPKEELDEEGRDKAGTYFGEFDFIVDYDLLSEAEILERRIHKQMRAESWRCSSCGQVCDPVSAEWRWAGSCWEHSHGGQLGHFPAQNFWFTTTHPGTGQPQITLTFEEAMQKWFEGFNPPVRVENGQPEKFDDALKRVRDSMPDTFKMNAPKP